MNQDEDWADDVDTSEFDLENDSDYVNIQHTRNLSRIIAATNKRYQTCGYNIDNIQAMILKPMKSNKKLIPTQIMTLMRDFYQICHQSYSTHCHRCWRAIEIGTVQIVKGQYGYYNRDGFSEIINNAQDAVVDEVGSCLPCWQIQGWYENQVPIELSNWVWRVPVPPTMGLTWSNQNCPKQENWCSEGIPPFEENVIYIPTDDHGRHQRSQNSAL